MHLIFILVAAPLLFFMLTWVVVTAYRICRPEEPLAYECDPATLHLRAREAGQSVPVGAREIREEQRHYRCAQSTYAYHTGGRSAGVPHAWAEDLWRRRN